MRTGCGHTKKRGNLGCDPVFCVILASPVKCPILKVRDVSQSLKYQDNSFTPSLVSEVFSIKLFAHGQGRELGRSSCV